MQLLDFDLRNNAMISHCTESHRQQCHLWTWKKRKLRTIRDYRWGVYLLQLLLLLPATSPRLSVTSLASCAPPLPGRCGLGGGITKAGPGRPLQCTSASTPPSWTYQSPPLPPKAPPPPGSSSSSLVSELGQEDHHSAPEASPALLRIYTAMPLMNLKK